jgi:hypothetical protein
MGANRSTGAYQYAVLAAVTGLGFVGAPWWMALIAAVLLFGSALLEHAELQSRVVPASATAAAGGSLLAVAATSMGFAAMCFIGGQALAGVLPVPG